MLKRIFILVGTAIASYISIVYGYLENHPLVLYIGIAVACIIGLGILVWLMKKTAQFIGWAFSSMLYVLISLVIVGVLLWNDVIPAFAGYISAILLSVFLIVSLVRNLSRWAQRSIIGGEIFAFLSNYQIRSYLDRGGRTLVDKDAAYAYNEDYKNIVYILRGLKYTKSEAQDAAVYAVRETLINQSIEDKVRVALNYLAESKSTISY